MNTLALNARKKAIECINRDWAQLICEAGKISESKIKLVNLGRRIGIEIQEVCGRDQLAFGFFQGFSQDLPESLTFEAAKKCVKLANILPEPVKTIEDANRAEQLLLEAAGLVEAPKRLEAHTSRDVAPRTFFFTAFADLRIKVTQKIMDWEKWDDETREGVRQEVMRAEKWIADVKQSLR